MNTNSLPPDWETQLQEIRASMQRIQTVVETVKQDILRRNPHAFDNMPVNCATKRDSTNK